MEICGKNVLLTGAGAGIGRCLLDLLVTEGAKVFAVDLVIEQIPHNVPNVIPFYCDLSLSGSVELMVKSAREQMGHVDIFIGNAAIAYFGLAAEKQWVDIEKLFRVNFLSPVFTVHEILQQQANHLSGVVIVASAIVKIPLPGYAYYAASKAALLTFFEVFREELPSRCHLTMVLPVATRTALLKHDCPAHENPWPVQSVEKVSHEIIRGIRRNAKLVSPSKIFALFSRISSILPIFRKMYLRAQNRRFAKFVARQSRTGTTMSHNCKE